MENLILSSISLPELKEMIREVLSTELKNTANSKPEINEKDELLTSSETAKLLGVSKVTLHKWKLAGKIKYYRIGSRIRFRQLEVMAALKGTENKR